MSVYHLMIGKMFVFIYIFWMIRRKTATFITKFPQLNKMFISLNCPEWYRERHLLSSPDYRNPNGTPLVVNKSRWNVFYTSQRIRDIINDRIMWQVVLPLIWFYILNDSRQKLNLLYSLGRARVHFTLSYHFLATFFLNFNCGSIKWQENDHMARKRST